MLYVVAWPVLAEADDTALRRLRAQYHPREAPLIGAHDPLNREIDARYGWIDQEKLAAMDPAFGMAKSYS